MQRQPIAIATRDFQPLKITVEDKRTLIRREVKFISKLLKEGYKGHGHFFRKDGRS